MSDLYGMHVRFRALPGRADELEGILLRAAEAAGQAEECRLYVVGRTAEDRDLVWVIETWSSQQAHDASLADPAARQLISEALPLLAERPESDVLRPSGGKGL